jgi:uncharacterized Zn-finger protein
MRSLIISELVFTEYFYNDKIKDSVMERSCSVGGCSEKHGICKSWPENLKRKDHLEDNIEMHVTESEWCVRVSAALICPRSGSSNDFCGHGDELTS